jgi:hypothetical protein
MRPRGRHVAIAVVLGLVGAPVLGAYAADAGAQTRDPYTHVAAANGQPGS